MFYVYVLLNERNKMYIGYTSDLEKRVTAHNKGDNTSTRGYKWELVYYEAYIAEVDAREREHRLKKSGQARRWLKERISNCLTQSRQG